LNLKETYSSLCSEFYDLDKPGAPEEALKFYLREIENSIKPVFEPMCGSGRFLIPVAERGFDIEGTDTSLFMINRCINKCREKNLSPLIHRQKLQELSLNKKFGLVFIPSGSFGLITEDSDVKECLKRIRGHLFNGGKFILEIENTQSIKNNSREEIPAVREVFRNEFSKIVYSAETDYDIKINIETTKCEYQNFINGELINTENEIIKVRHFSIGEFYELLKSAGFTDINALKPYSYKKASENNDTILFSCAA